MKNISYTASKGAIAIDFDGVIHRYSQGWRDGTIYDIPIDGALKSIEKIMDSGYYVFIHSTRKPKQIKNWLEDRLWTYHDISMGYCLERFLTYGYDCKIIPFWTRFWNEAYTLGITNRKLPAVAYIDDRAINFKNWEQTLKEINNIK